MIEHAGARTEVVVRDRYLELQLEAGRRPEGGSAVRARLPLETA